MFKILRILLPSATVLGGLYGIVAAMDSVTDVDATLVTAPAGTFRGKLNSTGSVREFLGIRYAQPAIGDLRWRSPRPLARVDRVQSVKKFGAHCPQPISPAGDGTITEDCLFLNVYSPTRKGDSADLLPVIVYIHGGTLITGQSDYFDATKLVEKGVVVVTINYRLGALGFLAHPALSSESPEFRSGNYGIEDQQVALRWVQQNIMAFGGDPGKVTLSGQSAGGFSTLINLVSPTAKGLFNRAIIMSGAYFQKQPLLAKSEAAGNSFVKAVGCDKANSIDVLKCLRSLSVPMILANQRLTYIFGPGIGPSPVVDGKIITMTTEAALASGNFNHVPLMDGTTHDESNLFVAENYDLGATGPIQAQNYESAISALAANALIDAPPATSQIADRYRVSIQNSNYDLAVGRAGTNAWFACPAQFVNDLTSPLVPTFAYEFNDENAPQNFHLPVSFPYGASHGSEVQYIFQLANPFPAGYHLSYPPLAADQRELSDRMINYWAQFAATGDPNGPGLPVWPQYDRKKRLVQSFAPPIPTTEGNFRVVHDCDFWDQLADRTLPSGYNVNSRR